MPFTISLFWVYYFTLSSWGIFNLLGFLLLVFECCWTHKKFSVSHLGPFVMPFTILLFWVYYFTLSSWGIFNLFGFLLLVLKSIHTLPRCLFYFSEIMYSKYRPLLNRPIHLGKIVSEYTRTETSSERVNEWTWMNRLSIDAHPVSSHCAVLWPKSPFVMMDWQKHTSVCTFPHWKSGS